MDVEKIIREALDGHFYVMRCGPFGMETVDVSTEETVNDDDEELVVNRGWAIDWSDKDHIIMEMRKAGKQYKEIAHAVGVHQATARWRFFKMCKDNGEDAVRDYPAYKKYNPVFEKQIVDARNAGETFQSIGLRFGLTKAQACTLYHRYMRRATRRKAA